LPEVQKFPFTFIDYVGLIRVSLYTELCTAQHMEFLIVLEPVYRLTCNVKSFRTLKCL